mmetsp:Transcript_22156/g.55874  ORF Transcript_22156/g.55874 Transcript_22156/m.55874 type:complete len:272 (-) Transcript_22156:2902-3717(-)
MHERVDRPSPRLVGVLPELARVFFPHDRCFRAVLHACSFYFFAFDVFTRFRGLVSPRRGRRPPLQLLVEAQAQGPGVQGSGFEFLYFQQPLVHLGGGARRRHKGVPGNPQQIQLVVVVDVILHQTLVMVGSGGPVGGERNRRRRDAVLGGGRRGGRMRMRMRGGGKHIRSEMLRFNFANGGGGAPNHAVAAVVICIPLRDHLAPGIAAILARYPCFLPRRLFREQGFYLGHGRGIRRPPRPLTQNRHKRLDRTPVLPKRDADSPVPVSHLP